MSNELNSEIDPGQPLVYQIRIKGHLGREWTDWFGGLTIRLTDNGETLLTGPVVDQAALHGLLRKVRDLQRCSENLSHLKAGTKTLSKDLFRPALSKLEGSIFLVTAVGVPLLSVSRVKPGEAEASGVNETHHYRSKKGGDTHESDCCSKT
jgi:hypothetical protein